MTAKEKLLVLRLIRRIVIDVYPVEYAHHHIEIERNRNVVFHKSGDRLSTRRENCGPSFEELQEVIAEILFEKNLDSIEPTNKNAFEWRIAFYTQKGCYQKCSGFIINGEKNDSPFISLLSEIENCLSIDFGLQFLKSKELASCMNEIRNTKNGIHDLSLSADEINTVTYLSEKILLSIAKHNKLNNSIISPISIMIVLAVLAHISNTSSKKEIEELFSLEAGEIWKIGVQLNTALNTNTRILSAVNALFAAKGYADLLDPDTISLLSNALGIHQFDSGCTASDINEWASGKTKRMITHLIDRTNELGDISFLNAICFDAKWAIEYKKWNIEDGKFHALNGNVQDVSVLLSSERRYLSNEHACGFLKAYKNCSYSFVALLPRHTQDPHEMLSAMDDGELFRLISNPQEAIVNVVMPEFAFEQTFSVKDILKEHNVVSVFDPQAADIRGLISIPGSFIADICQKARIEVNRNGTRAAAVTRLAACLGAPPKLECYEVKLDRPFVFGIVDDQTCIPLFLGIVNHI